MTATRSALDTLVADVDSDELVLVHDRGATVHRVEVDDLVERIGPGVDLVVGAWTQVDADHGVVQRRGVFSPERLRWCNTVGPALLVSGRALQRSGWGSDGSSTMHDLLLRLSELDPPVPVASEPVVLAHVDDLHDVEHPV